MATLTEIIRRYDPSMSEAAAAWHADQIRRGNQTLHGLAERLGADVREDPDAPTPVERPDAGDAQGTAGVPGGPAAPGASLADEQARQAEEQRQRDAMGRIRDVLRSYDLEALVDWAWRMVREGRSATEVVQLMFEQPEFRERFPAIFMRQERGLPAISPAEYIAFEETAGQLLREAGLPPGFYDQTEDFTAQIASGMSVRALSRRVQQGFARVTSLPDVVRDEFADIFGPSGDAALASLFLDPKRALPTLMEQVRVAETSGAGLMFGFDVGRGTATGLARAGATFESSLPRFRQAAQLRPLTRETVSERRDITEDELVSSVFDLDGSVENRLESRLESRTAAFSGRGGAFRSREGLGLGAADD